jgi:hypothetical protein
MSVLGFMLGMQRKEVFKAAQRAGVSLDDDSGQACLKAKTCQVFNQGKYRGMSPEFNAEDFLESFVIEIVRKDASRDERSAWLVTEFQGETRRLAESYSDNLRIRILGNVDSYWVKYPSHRSIWQGKTTGTPPMGAIASTFIAGWV